MTNNKRIAIAVIVFVLLIIIIIVITLITGRKPSTGIEFIVVPDNATVVIDSKKVTVNYESVIKTETGTVTVELSKDGFESKTETIDVKEGSISSLYVYLKPLTDAAKEEVKPTIMQQRIERIGGHFVTKSTEAMGEKYSFINKLPIVEKYYTITPCSVVPTDLNVMGICVTLAIDNPYYRDEALKSMQANGIDPTKWTVIYGNQFDHAD